MSSRQCVAGGIGGSIMSALFTQHIEGWISWGRVYQNLPAWEPLIRYIFQKKGLPCGQLEHLTPGTNAVFRVGGYVIKIYAPKESGIDSTTDIETEAFAAGHVGKLGIPVPECAVCGVLEDKYYFAYMIMKYIEGTEFTKAAPGFTEQEKISFGRRLRDITDQMNIPCATFNGIDVIRDQGRYRRWDKYADTFRAERLAYLAKNDFGEKVFVHGDLCGDNILITDAGGIYIIDFADAVQAPVLYEQALVASELFHFDKAYLQGYLGKYDEHMLTELCFQGLLIHDFGGDIVAQHIAKPEEIVSLAILKERIFTAIQAGSQL